jgi:pimeloyl-ACP methyl ester carboxylesterase
MNETVVLVHGIWMLGFELLLLARRLRRAGYHTRVFHYRSLRRPLTDNAQRLAAFVRAQGPGRVHLVGHSLGGLVILQALEDNPGLIDGHVVLLGSPVNGSVIARRVHRFRVLRWAVGRAVPALLHGGPRWQGTPALAMIAGTRAFGVGTFLGGFDGANDGTVAVAETLLPGVSDSARMHSSHFGLVVSPRVARATRDFLQQGRLEPG